MERKLKKQEKTSSLSLEDLQQHFAAFVDATEDARALSEKCVDYKHGNQWTEQQIARLKARGQAPIVVNRVKAKVEGLLGLAIARKSDPKAYPRTQKHEKASEAITDALRYVADNNDFATGCRLEVAEDLFVAGYGGASVYARQKKGGDVEVVIDHIPWDRIYFDPHSRRKDFSDASYLGYMLWMDEAEVRDTFPDLEEDAFVQTDSAPETYEDRPRWFTKEKGRNRYRVAYEFFKYKGEWWFCIFTEGGYLVKPQVSPFLDDDGEPAPNVEFVSAYVDRDNNRYGEVATFLDQQDEINHRRSKALHLLSQRQTYGRRGVKEDVAKVKRELSKPDGHVEFDGQEFGKDFGILPTSDMAQGQFELYQDAKSELDAVSFNAQLSGDRQSGDLSGKAIQRLQSAGAMETNGLFNSLSGWEKRIYRQIWARVKQFWNEEKWIRVTDDQDNLRWVGLNSQVTTQDKLQEFIEDEANSLELRTGASAMLQALQQSQDPRLQEIIEVKNPVPELDVDIILDQSFDTVNVQEEQFQLLAQFGRGSDIDIIELIELSQLRGKDELIEKIEKRRATAAQAAGNVQQMQAQGEQAKMRKTMAEATEKEQSAIQKSIENNLLVQQPERISQISV